MWPDRVSIQGPLVLEWLPVETVCEVLLPAETSDSAETLSGKQNHC